jgi:hypothetical protein
MVAANGFDVGDGTDLRFLCCNGGADWPFQFICDKLDSRYPNQKYRAEAFYALAILVNNSEPKNQALYDRLFAQYYRLKGAADAESVAGSASRRCRRRSRPRLPRWCPQPVNRQWQP